MEKKEETKQYYEIIILRHDNQHIVVLRSDVYDKCFETWTLLSDRWEKAVIDKVPFRLTEPVVTAHDPGLIKEIVLRPLMKVEESKYNNPYQRRMLNDGLSNMLENNMVDKGNALNPNILDEGYNS